MRTDLKRTATTYLNGFTNANTILFLIISIFILCVTYVVKMNVVSGRGYELRTLEKSIHSTRTDIEQLQYKIALELSSENMVNKTASIGMVEPVSVKYVVGDSSGYVALR